jgi:hypothetical protein
LPAADAVHEPVPEFASQVVDPWAETAMHWPLTHCLPSRQSVFVRQLDFGPEWSLHETTLVATTTHAMKARTLTA